MASYTNMSTYYDVIMTPGPYDYEKIVHDLLDYLPFQSILEIGCGTGLVLEKLAKKLQHIERIMGMDITESMLTIAQERLRDFPNVFLSCQDVVNLTLNEQYDVAFSYGGTWSFVVDGDQEPFLVSHLSDDSDNQKSFAMVAKYVKKNGKLLLGKNGPHYDSERIVSNGMKYSQKITPCEHGFIKNYFLTDGTKIVMEQTLHFRTYSLADTQQLLATYGFEYQLEQNNGGLFMEFKKL